MTRRARVETTHALVLACLLALSVTACTAGPPPPDAARAVSTDATSLVAIPNARVPLDGVLSGGQPSEEQIREAAAAGFRTVINLRTAEEPGFEWEAGTVEKLGMRYVQIPVAGAAGLTRGNVERIDEALARGLEDGPVLLHCGSGNRIGAVLALRRAWLEGESPEQALRFGLANGLTRLEDATRAILERKAPEGR